MSAPPPHWDDPTLATLTPDFFKNLEAMDPIALLLELKRLGHLDALTRGEPVVAAKLESDSKLFLASQVVCRYLSQNIQGFANREAELQAVQIDLEADVSYYVYICVIYIISCC
jgi:hypothetical protein